MSYEIVNKLYKGDFEKGKRLSSNNENEFLRKHCLLARECDEEYVVDVNTYRRLEKAASPLGYITEKDSPFYLCGRKVILKE